MISKNLAKEVLNVCLSTGADFAEIFLEDTEIENIVLDNGNCETATNSVIYGAGIRLLNNLQSVYGYTNDISKKGLLALASSLSNSFNESRKLEVKSITTKRVSTKHQPEIDYKNISKEEKINYLLKGSNACKSYNHQI